ncbi:MAG TPA: ATP-binding cassette domain-containing protein [Anaerolineales bacterium]|nr:ATP-binding cassette domain-containing protein [Anaerolineales bacterium]HMV96492.1 ATP-binding cassette domain-containing protein [Anaerolineales bacterium]HMX20355.1 ATP-binding cassette domain-containing protein [Anaerolineales bacterium]HMX75885.1 ATP-binding cassette domain-containing protein [Anaerolineales bacterium]HMZ44026.1 ATP-binding cassette domain-containing protein [Anaerolineales bacterium]
MAFFQKNNHTSTDTRPMIDLRDVNKFYKTAIGDYQALNNIDLQINAGEFVSIIGKSGSGKTTLLNMITGIDIPTNGEVWVNDTAVHKLSENKMARWRGKNLGVVFQFFQLLPMISVIENIMLPMDFCRTYPMRERHQRAMQLLELVELADHAHKLPTALSGGQQQRVAIARALANDPPVIIADEPTGNLDSKTAESVFSLFNDLVSKGKTIIIVTHDSALAKRTHRTALIADGEIVNEYVAKAMPTLTAAQLLQLTRSAKTLQFEPGAMILSEGTHADTFYVVSKGTVEVVLPRTNQSDVVALQLGPGKCFGEIEFFHEKKHLASVRASESGPVEVVSIEYGQLKELLDQSQVTRDALHQMADKHEDEHMSIRGGSK